MTYELRVTGRMDPPTLVRVRQEYAQLSAEEKQFPNPDYRGFNLSESIAAQNPCRVITLCPTFGEDTGVTAQVSAYCPVQKKNSGNLICCEYITLKGTKAALERVSGLVSSLILPDLPKFVWWKATPSPEQPIFRNLAKSSNCIIVDSSYFSDAEAELKKKYRISLRKAPTSPTSTGTAWPPGRNWPPPPLTPPERRDSLLDIDRISIDYEQGNAAQAWMYLGWFASRLQWEPTGYEEEGGMYNIKKNPLQRPQWTGRLRPSWRRFRWPIPAR